MTHDELIHTPEYWTTLMQLKLYEKVEKYLKENNLNRTQLAEKLGVSKGYISQVLNGNYDHKISKLVELSLAVGYFPDLAFNRIEKKTYSREEVDNILSNIHSTLETVGKYAMIYERQLKHDDELSTIYCEKENITKPPKVA